MVNHLIESCSLILQNITPYHLKDNSSNKQKRKPRKRWISLNSTNNWWWSSIRNFSAKPLTANKWKNKTTSLEHAFSTWPQARLMPLQLYRTQHPNQLSRQLNYPLIVDHHSIQLAFILKYPSISCKHLSQRWLKPIFI
jgi:hypothetical protein